MKRIYPPILLVISFVLMNLLPVGWWTILLFTSCMYFALWSLLALLLPNQKKDFANSIKQVQEKEE